MGSGLIMTNGGKRRNDKKKSRVGRSVGRSVGLLSKAKGRGESLRALMEKQGEKLSKEGKKIPNFFFRIN